MGKGNLDCLEYNNLLMKLYLRYKNTTRVLLTLIRHIESKGEMNEFLGFFKEEIIGEKEFLLDVLTNHLEELEGLESPRSVIEKKKEEIQLVKSTIDRLRKEKNEHYKFLLDGVNQDSVEDLMNESVNLIVGEKSPIYEYEGLTSDKWKKLLIES